MLAHLNYTETPLLAAPRGKCEEPGLFWRDPSAKHVSGNLHGPRTVNKYFQPYIHIGTFGLNLAWARLASKTSSQRPWRRPGYGFWQIIVAIADTNLPSHCSVSHTPTDSWQTRAG